MDKKQKLIVLAVLGVLNIFLIWKIYDLVIGDVRMQQKTDKIDKMVIDKLSKIRDCQVAYRDMTGDYAKDFDELIKGIKDGKIKQFKSVGDKDKNPDLEVQIDTFYKDAMIEVFGTRDYPIENLALVPPHDTAVFLMETDYVEKNEVTLPVFQVVDPHPFNPDRTLKVGSLVDAIETGNWR
jgi:hypothetical protein